MSFERQAKKWVDGSIGVVNLALKGIGGLELDHLLQLGFQGNPTPGGGFAGVTALQGGILSVGKGIYGGGGEFEVVFSKSGENSTCSVNAKESCVKITFIGNDGTVSRVKFSNETGVMTVKVANSQEGLSMKGTFDPENPLDNPSLFLGFYNTVQGLLTHCALSFGPLAHGVPGGLMLDDWKHKHSPFDPNFFGVAPLPGCIGNTKFKKLLKNISEELENIFDNLMLANDIFIGGLSDNSDPAVDFKAVLAATAMCQSGKAVNFKGVFPTASQLYQGRARKHKIEKSKKRHRGLGMRRLSVSMQGLSVGISDLPLSRSVLCGEEAGGRHRRRHRKNEDYISGPLEGSLSVESLFDSAASQAMDFDSAGLSTNTSPGGAGGSARELINRRRGGNGQPKHTAPKQQRMR